MLIYDKTLVEKIPCTARLDPRMPEFNVEGIGVPDFLHEQAFFSRDQRTPSHNFIIEIGEAGVHLRAQEIRQTSVFFSCTGMEVRDKTRVPCGFVQEGYLISRGGCMNSDEPALCAGQIAMFRTKNARTDHLIGASHSRVAAGWVRGARQG